MHLKKICSIACMLSLVTCLSSCFAANYTSEYKTEKETVFINDATVWFTENMPAATETTYDLLTKSYITDVVHGTFKIDNALYNYAWVEGTETLYTDRLCDGTSYSVCEDRFENLIASMFHEGSVDVAVSTSAWSYPCSYYGNHTVTGSSGESSNVETVLDGEFDYSYFKWGTTQDEMWVWCEDVLSRKTDALISVTAEITYDSYSDIESELMSKTCMNAYPGLDRLTFRTENESGYYTITRENDTLVSEWHHKVENGDSTKWVVDKL